MFHSLSQGNSVWQGKTAIVVGASAGLGRHLVEALAKSKASQITLVARDADRLGGVVKDFAVRWPAVKFSGCAADVTAVDGSARLADFVGGMEDRTDLLICAAGLSDRGSLMNLTAQRLEELFRANVLCSLRALQIVAPQMAQGGVIVNIGSLSSHFAPRFLGGYSLAKHALRALTQQARLEFREQNLHVMLVCPGPIARSDSGQRYSQLATANDLPPTALGSGGGAKIRGLDPTLLSNDILRAAANRQVELVRPRKALWLIWFMTFFPRWGESILKRMTA